VTPSIFAQISAEAAEQSGSLGISGAILLLCAGLVLLGLEIFLPGMICGIIGAILLFIGIGGTFYYAGMLGGALAILATGVALLAGFWFYIKILPQTKIGRHLFLSDAIEGAGASAPGDDSLIGQSGTAETVLAPSGIVRVGSDTFEAVSRDGFVERGENIVVHGRETLRLIVGKK